MLMSLHRERLIYRLQFPILELPDKETAFGLLSVLFLLVSTTLPKIE